MSKVTLNGEAVKLVGDELSVGDYAPEVELVLADLKTLKVGGSSEKIQVIATVPSLDTGVCAMETKKFNEKIAISIVPDEKFFSPILLSLSKNNSILSLIIKSFLPVILK